MILAWPAGRSIVQLGRRQGSAVDPDGQGGQAPSSREGVGTAMGTQETSAGPVRQEARRIGRGPILPVGGPGMADAAFIEGEIEGLVIRPLTVRQDSRGWLVELFRHDELESERWPRMAYASMTLPGVARGPHEHADQTDGFAFIGPSDFRLFAWDLRARSDTRGHRLVVVVGASNPASVWIPPGVVHAYRNVGEV